MIAETDTRMIEPELAFFGPIGFDAGTLIGSLPMNRFSQDGHAEQTGTSCADHQACVLDTVDTKCG